ncbi:U6 snRNA-associated Sm LSm1 [Brachionus plicatilis]|uniref:U6 snRNA-associated Sm-like protein LSm1 n=1 Tax=Brachionus plicatilis TaxID=10195 RepID=A0A3M7RAR9_BRAPC|nr:U6 snRNA-associated Sm LSm1 [Brachionus plicatilis]
MSDAVSELDAFLKSMSKLKSERVQMAPPPGLPFPQASHFSQLPSLPELPPKPMTEQDLLSMYPHSSQSSSLLSQMPLPNTDFDFDLNKNCLLEDDFQKLTFNSSYQSGNDRNYSSMDHSRASHNISLNETQADSVIYSSNKYYMPGTASLIEDVDKQLMVVLRDGKTLIGYLRSIDQYANLLLSNTIERIHVGKKYGDIPRGVYIVRGENVVLIGEVDFNKECKIGMINVGVDEILELKRNEEIKEQEIEKNKKKAMMNRCLMPQTDSILDDYY